MAKNITIKKRNGVEKKLERIQRSLDNMELGRYFELDISYCCDYLAWCAKYKKVNENVWLPMVLQATSILNNNFSKGSFDNGKNYI